ncbi:MAG TPA: hypothetical protein VFQ76_06995 [Longimicrobiaceae bacterium]|nr:hypothetical protein [Longimicrobiaceae bacterium]
MADTSDEEPGTPGADAAPQVSELRDVVRRFSSLIQHGTGSAGEDERQLAVLCDRLALAAQARRERADAGGSGEAPGPDRQRTRMLAAARFPRLGHYNTVAHTSVAVGAGDAVVGDAIDDVADIADELAEVAWHLENTGEADALRHFVDGYDHHWGAHLRRLQLYLYCVDRGL